MRQYHGPTVDRDYSKVILWLLVAAAVVFFLLTLSGNAYAQTTVDTASEAEFNTSSSDSSIVIMSLIGMVTLAAIGVVSYLGHQTGRRKSRLRETP